MDRSLNIRKITYRTTGKTKPTTENRKNKTKTKLQINPEFIRTGLKIDYILVKPVDECQSIANQGRNVINSGFDLVPQ